MNLFQDKVVLITGAGKGAGRKLAEAFAERGAIVAANDISPINVEEVVQGICTRGGRANSYIEDIARKVGAQSVVNRVEDDFGRIDVLINHAAVAPHFPLLTMDEWDWHRALDVNLTGAFLMMQSVGRVMIAQGGGVILNLVGESGTGADKEAAYRVSKAGLAELSMSANQELTPFGVRVYSLKDLLDPVHSIFTLLEEE